MDAQPNIHSLRQRDKLVVVMPLATVQTLFQGLRQLVQSEPVSPYADFRMPNLQWDVERLRRQYEELHKKFAKNTDKANGRVLNPALRFANEVDYISAQSSAVFMNGLSLHLPVLHLRHTAFRGRFYRTANNQDAYVLLVNTVRPLSAQYGGVLEQQVKPGCELNIGFYPPQGDALKGIPPCTGVLGSAAWKRSDRRCWKAEFINSPFQTQLPLHIACLKVYRGCKIHDDFDTDKIQLCSNPATDRDPRSYDVYFKFPDPSKVDRRRYNGVVRFAERRSYEWSNLWGVDDDSEYDDDSDVKETSEPEAFRSRKSFTSILLGTSVQHYAEDDFLVGIEPVALARVLANIPESHRAARKRYLGRVPCGLYLCAGAGGTGKSFNIAIMVSLCVLQKKKVSVVANQHRAVDSTIHKIVDMFQRDGIQRLVIRTYDDRTDTASTLAVADGIPLHLFRTVNASRWKPHLSLAFWVAWLLGQDGVTAPLPDNHELRQRPQVLTLKSDINLSLTHPEENTRRAAECAIPSSVKSVVQMLLSEAAVVGSTAYGCLYKHVKKFTKEMSNVLVVEEAGAITEAEVLSCIFRQKRYIMSFDHRQLPPYIDGTNQPLAEQLKMALAIRLRLISWPIDVMDQQHRMLPGMMDPARYAFYQHDGIKDVFKPDRDVSIARVMESWAQYWGRGVTAPPRNQFWPVFLNITGTHCQVAPASKSSINISMWDEFVPVLETHILDPDSEWYVPAEEIAIVIPYREMLAHAEADLEARGINVRIGLPNDDRSEIEQGHESASDATDDQDDASSATSNDSGPLVPAPVVQTVGEDAPVERRNPNALAAGTVDACKFCFSASELTTSSLIILHHSSRIREELHHCILYCFLIFRAEIHGQPRENVCCHDAAQSSNDVRGRHRSAATTTARQIHHWATSAQFRANSSCHRVVSATSALSCGTSQQFEVLKSN